MRWMMLALIPLLICGAVMLGGLVLTALGIRHISNRGRDTNVERDDIYTRV